MMPDKSRVIQCANCFCVNHLFKVSKREEHWFLKIFFGNTEKTDNQHYSRYPYVIYPNKDKNLMKLLNLNAVIT